MVRFLSLWLGLVSGPLPVELAAGPEVAAVELRLDGAAVARVDGAPWTTTLDLGRQLLPHEVVAVAFAADGRETGRAAQRLNLPRPPAEVTVALEGDPRAPRAVLLGWEAVAGLTPRSVAVWLDGVALPPPADPRRWILPPAPYGVPRLLRVEVTFPGDLVAGREAVFGATVSEEVAHELTAVALDADGHAADADRLALRRGDAAVPVLAMEKGEVDLQVVLDPAAVPVLAALADELRGRRVRTVGGGSVRRDPRDVAPLDPATRLRVLSPRAERHAADGVARDVFRPGAERSAAAGGLLWHLVSAGVSARSNVADAGRPRFADAVALAGLGAVERSRRRAVVLVLGGGTADDASQYSAAVARRYLAALGVPLRVWTVGEATPRLVATWGDLEEIGSAARFETAARRLDRLLDRQRIAWVAGSFLPQEIAVAAPPGVRRAGVPEGPIAEPNTVVADSRAVATAPAAPPEPPAPPIADVTAGLVRHAAGRFVLATDLADAATVARLRRVAEALPATFAGRYGVAPAGDGVLGELVVFARDDDFRAFLAREDPSADVAVRGHARAGRAVLAAGDRTDAELLAVFLHEATHLLVRASFGRRLAPWLEEGLAEDLAMSEVDEDGTVLPGTLAGDARLTTLVRDRRRGGTPVVVEATGAHGNLASLLAAYQRRALPFLPELLALEPEAFTRLDGRRDRYSAAGFLVRFLLDAAGGRRAGAFRAFLTAAAGGAPTDSEALAAALGEPLPRLQTRFVAWLRLASELAR